MQAVCNLSVCRRVNRQYKHNLSCTVHDHRRLYRRKHLVGILSRVAKYLLEMSQSPTFIPRDTVSIDILQRVEKYLLEMLQSPTSLQADKVRRYFTESWEIFIANATITKLIPTDKFRRHLSIVHNYRQTYRRMVWIPNDGY